MDRLRFVAKVLVHGAIELSGRPHRQRNLLRGKLLVLTYHSFCEHWPKGLFGSLPISRFEEHVRFLRRRFNLVSLEEGLERLRNGDVGDRPWVTITIDDGFGDNYALAWPVLKFHQVPATIFVATDFLDTGRPPWPTQIIDILERTSMEAMDAPFRASLKGIAARAKAAVRLKRELASLPPVARFEQISELRRHLRVGEHARFRPLTWAQVREMHASGLGFGSHTVYHSILPMVDPSLWAPELLDSKKRLETELQVRCTTFAYPDGKHSEKTGEALHACGYDVALTQDPGFNDAMERRLALRRIEMPWHDPMQSFRCRTSLSLASI